MWDNQGPKYNSKNDFGDCYDCKNAILKANISDDKMDIYCFCVLFHQFVSCPDICCGKIDEEQEEMNKFINK